MSKEKLEPCPSIHTCVGQLDGLCTISHNEHYRKPCPKSLKEYLKPCPFCGGKANIQDCGVTPPRIRVNCINKGCKVIVCMATFAMKKTAIKNWNKRAK